jgi:dipeptidase
MFGAEDMNKYLDWAKGDATAEAIPLYMKPKKPLSLQDVMNGMRDHYEGTPFDLSGEIAGGMFDMPYRLSPLSFEVDGVKYFNERPISTFQSAFVFVAQMRRSLPNAVGGVLWFGCDDADMMIYTPVYCCTDRVPDCYAEKYADPVTFSWKSSYWVFNWVANMVYPKYSLVIDDLRRVQRGFESRTIEECQALEAEIAKNYKSSPAFAKRQLTDYTCRVAEDALAEWKKFAEYMIVKYNDFAIKPEKNGKFERTPSGVGANVKRPGYPKAFLKEHVKQTGDKYVIPAKK